ncbi:hypothetical protein ALC53_12380 [Atta colombica]|uniref:Uncharacterized protein n=1 Tax=Atta colombica TaxID=520822 RepID=A0A195AY06_9HYME|nr:hypothetical protein ALC53_12380 [Atta colombica]
MKLGLYIISLLLLSVMVAAPFTVPFNMKWYMQTKKINNNRKLQLRKARH